MKAELTKNVYAGSDPVKGDIIIRCVKGEVIDPALVKQYKDQLLATKVISVPASKPTKKEK